MRVLALDVGSKRIGVAISDPLGITAQGLPTIARSPDGREIEEIAAIVETYRCERVVVGLPRRTDGTCGPEATEVMDFVERLKERIDVPVIAWDERFTTVMAEKALLEADMSRKKRRRVIDKVSAVLILQSYLDSQKPGDQG